MCPLCDAPEDNIHVVQRRSKTSNDRWASSIDALKEKLLDDGILTNTVNMIVNQLHSWRGHNYELPTHTSASLFSALVAQNLI